MKKKQKHLIGGKWVLTRRGGRGIDVSDDYLYDLDDKDDDHEKKRNILLAVSWF